MVILQFNKLIRNKWVWGVFAIAISAFFAFDFLIAGLNDENRPEEGSTVGKLGADNVKAADFFALADEVRGLGKMRNDSADEYEVNRLAWENLAALAVAKKNGIEATVQEVRQALAEMPQFQENGGFSYPRYMAFLRQMGVPAARCEEMIRHNISLNRATRAMLESAAWMAPAELERAISDSYDTYTVRVAEFEQSKEDADKVVLDEAGLRKWYDDNTNSIALPERVRIRLVRYDAHNPDLLARVTVTEDEMNDLFVANSQKYTRVDTNGNTVAMSFEEAKPQLEREAKVAAAVECLQTNLNARLFVALDAGAGATNAAPAVSRLEVLAKEDSLKVETSDWFSTDGRTVDGFMVRPESVCPGAVDFVNAVAQLDDVSEDERYNVVSSEDAVWAIEKVKTSPAHLPTFDEAKEIIRPRALADAKADAFKKVVEDLAAKGTNELFKVAKKVSASCTFVPTNLTALVSCVPPYTVRSVSFAAQKLHKGELSPFVRTGENTAVVVVCEDRLACNDGAVEKLPSRQLQAEPIRGAFDNARVEYLVEKWRKWNLTRQAFEPGVSARVEAPKADENGDEDVE